MSFSFANLSDALKNGAAISPADVLDARRWAWSDGDISAAEADAIFELNRLATNPPAEWIDFFVEALTEFVVNEQPPRGYVDESNATWLIAQIDRDGRVETLGELELLTKIMEVSINVPPALKSYALAQIERTVVTGEGPTRRDGTIRPGAVDDAEVKLLRRLIFAGASEGGLTVSVDEAEMLLRIKEACKDAPVSPEWQKLFVQALGNHLMVSQAYKALDRAEAIRLDAFANDTSTNVAGFLGRMAKSLASSGVRPGFAAGSQDEEALVAPETITASEAAWLKRQIEADGALDPLERALLAFVIEENGGRPEGL